MILLHQFLVQDTPTKVSEMLSEHPDDILGLFDGTVLVRVISSVVIAGERDAQDLAYFAYGIFP